MKISLYLLIFLVVINDINVYLEDYDYFLKKKEKIFTSKKNLCSLMFISKRSNEKRSHARYLRNSGKSRHSQNFIN